MTITSCTSNQKSDSKETVVLENIATRVSVRSYLDKPVDDATIEKLLRAGMAAHAPLAIVVCGDLDRALEGIAQEYWVQDCSAATQNILLAANAMGLGSVWTGSYPIKERCEAISKILQLPENVLPLNTIVIGYPERDNTPKDKWDPNKVSYNIY